MVMANRKVRVYEYSNCSTCKKALQYLEKRKVEFERVPIVERPPTENELRAMATHLGGAFRKLFNTSGQLYREMKIGEKMGSMDLDEAVKLLSKHGKLVKRPFLLADSGGVVGFKQDEWDRLIGKG